MRRMLLTFALLACAAPSADAGFLKKVFGKRQKAAECPCVAATGVCPCGDNCPCGVPSASATSQGGVLRWAGRVVTSPVRTVAGAASCQNGKCRRN